jgi:hypothetical protein
MIGSGYMKGRRAGHLLGMLLALILFSALATTLPPAADSTQPRSAGIDRGAGDGFVRLAVRPAQVRPGKSIRLRLENKSSDSIEFGEEFSIQMKIRRRWTKASFSPNGPWFEVLLGLPPGHAGALSTFAIPSSAPAGMYRAVKPIVIDGSTKFRTAGFHVLR